MRTRSSPLILATISVASIAIAGSCGPADSTAPEASTPTPPVTITTREWRDVAYASGSAAQRLDLYLPPTGNGPFPVVVWVHGGGWQGGSKALGANAFQRRVLERGMALASVGYRLSGEAVWPAQIHDVKAAVRWLRANAARHGLDSARVGAWGSSAGGHLVALLGTSGGVAALEGALGNAAASSRVGAVVDWYGPTDFLKMDEQALAIGCRASGHSRPDSPESQLLGGPVTERPALVREASPLTYASADDPPFHIAHGSADCTVAYPQSELLRDALRPLLGADRVEYTLLAGAGHGGPEFSAAANLDRALSFLARWLAR